MKKFSLADRPGIAKDISTVPFRSSIDGDFSLEIKEKFAN